MNILFIILIAAVILGGILIRVYNKLVQRRNRVKNAWAQIDVQLQKRFDLIPNLMETVKGAASHEEETLTKIIEARNNYQNAATIDEKIKVNNNIQKLFSTVNALHENYPDLKANAAYMKFMESLSSIEEQISVSRLFYNDTVNLYNDDIMVFPNNIAAGIFGFKEHPLFNVSDEARNNIKVQF